MVFLYGRRWSPEDAAYAKELEVSDLPTTEIVRLWRESRPSVRKAVNGSPVAEIGGPVTKPVTEKGPPVTKPPASEAPVTKPAGGRPTKGEKAASDAERMRAYRERKRGG